MRPKTRLIRRCALIVLVVGAVSACGDEAARDTGSTPPGSSSSSPTATEVGTELTGVAFDVRIDPG